MRISIALCTYNGEEYLDEQLESLLSQTRLPDEIVVCDDRSTDGTVEILEKFAAAAPFPVRIQVNEDNLGSTKNFARAIALCRGELIFLSDQDDVWQSEKLEKFTAVFDADAEIGLVFCNGELVDERLGALGITAWEAISFDRSQQKKIGNGGGLKIILQRNIVTGCLMAFRAQYKSLFLPIPDDVHNVIHDCWIAIIIAASAKVKLIPELLVKYRQHSRQQLGLGVENAAPKKNAREKAVHKTDFNDTLMRLNDLKRVFQNWRQNADKRKIDISTVLREIDLQTRHLQARVKIAERRRQSFSLIIGELLSLRYHYYSRGWLSVIKDLSLYFSN